MHNNFETIQLDSAYFESVLDRFQKKKTRNNFKRTERVSNFTAFSLSNHYFNLKMPRRIKEESEEEWDENEEDTESEEEEERRPKFSKLSKSNQSNSETESEYEEGSSGSEYEDEPTSKRRKTSSGVNMRVSQLVFALKCKLENKGLINF